MQTDTTNAMFSAINGLNSQKPEEVRQAMALIWLLVYVCYSSKISPLTEMRKRFPDFDWNFHRDVPTGAEVALDAEPDLAEEHFGGQDYIWEFQDGHLLAKRKVQGTGKYTYNMYESFIDSVECLERFTHFASTKSGDALSPAENLVIAMTLKLQRL